MSSAQGKDNLKQSMQTAADRFYNLQRRYYMNDIQDTELTEVVTQPFWQSMRLSKKRLQEKELTMDVAVWEEKGRNHLRGNVFVHKDGCNQVGMTIREVAAKRIFYHKGKKIYSKKEHDIATVSLLKTEVDGESAACPNCGHVGKIAEYIDGCDYCGSKFTVKDFEPKVSGFSLEENTRKKVTSTFLKTLAFLGVCTLILGMIAFVSGVVFVLYAMTSQETKGLFASMLSLFASLDLLPVLGNTIWILFFLFIALGGLLIFLVPGQIKRERIVKAVIPDFSSQDFFQHLEHKLRNIHLTSHAGEVNSFACFDLAQIVDDYENVVDCQMRSIKFLTVTPTQAGYMMDVEVNLKLQIFNGRRIRTKYESVRLLLSGKREILEKSTMAIREYKCPNCNSSISLLEGGICQYCGTKLDYENYGWVLQSYEKKFKLLHTYRWIQLAMVGFYVLVFLYSYKTSNTEENNALELLEDMLGAEEAVNGFYDDILKPDELGTEAVLASRTDEYVYRKCTYTVSDADTVAETYRKALEAQGVEYDEASATENSYNMYKLVEYAGDTGYVKLTVTYGQQELVVEYNLAEYVGE